jgi:hypothetical protein
MASEAYRVRNRQAATLRAIYAICLLAGTSTHVATLWLHGFSWDYGGAPVFTRAYWTLLTFLDPLAAILLYAYQRAGLLATLAIISTDVAHNLWFLEHHHIQLTWTVAAQGVSQCAFLVFVLATFRSAWRGLDATPARG